MISSHKLTGSHIGSNFFGSYRTEYLTLEDAYDAYITALNNAKYDEVRESSRG